MYIGFTAFYLGGIVDKPAGCSQASGAVVGADGSSRPESRRRHLLQHDERLRACHVLQQCHQRLRAVG
eukprot:7014710-Lingulodinium_polyedra.AAC.1